MRIFDVLSFAAVIAVTQGISGARAADDVFVPGTETNFGGFYVGAEIAHSIANNQIGLSELDDSITVDGWGADGISGGMFVGYDHLLDNGFLIGGQIGGHWSDITSSISYYEPNVIARGQLKTDWLATASARAGYLVNPETLVFSSIGLTVAHGVGSYYVDDGGGVLSDSDEEFFYGVALGSLGVETVLGGNLRGRFEYVASYLTQQSFTFDDLELDVTPIIGTAKVSLVYGFGAPSPVETVFVNAPESWTGFFGGLRGGHDMGNTELSVGDPDVGGVFDGFGSNGLMGGGFVGYNHQFGSRFVVGVEGGVSASTINFEVNADIGGVAIGRFSVGTEWAANARLRAGVLVNPSTLIFGYGGYSRNHMYGEISDGGITERETFSVNAYEFGGGVETFVADGVSVRGEYGISLTENLLEDIDDFGSLKKTGGTGSVAAVFHF